MEDKNHSYSCQKRWVSPSPLLSHHRSITLNQQTLKTEVTLLHQTLKAYARENCLTLVDLESENNLFIRDILVVKFLVLLLSFPTSIPTQTWLRDKHFHVGSMMKWGITQNSRTGNEMKPYSGLTLDSKQWSGLYYSCHKQIPNSGGLTQQEFISCSRHSPRQVGRRGRDPQRNSGSQAPSSYTAFQVLGPELEHISPTHFIDQNSVI